MHATRALRSGWLRRALSIDKNRAALPAPFLCPAVAVAHCFVRPPQQSFHLQSRRLHLEHGNSTDEVQTDLPQLPARALPLQCSGCGALSQSANAGQAGYFSLDRKAVRSYLGLLKPEKRVRDEDQVLQDVLRNADHASLAKVGVDIKDLLALPQDGDLKVLDAGKNAVHCLFDF